LKGEENKGQAKRESIPLRKREGHSRR